MKKLIVIILILLLLCGCKTMPDEYPFKNANDNIVSVELLYNPHANEGHHDYPFELSCVLGESESVNFMNRVMQLETSKCLTPPPSNYGFYIARVTYDDGDVELFGTWHIEFVENGSEPWGVGSYSFDGDDFEILIKEYIEKYGQKGDERTVPLSLGAIA